MTDERDAKETVFEPATRTARTSGVAQPGAPFTTGDIVADRYRIVGLLGRGGMGEVYRAEDLTLEQPVALKFLSIADAHGDRIDRLRGEVRVTRQVSHPNVCRVYDVGFAGGRHFLSMEYVDGEDVAYPRHPLRWAGRSCGK
jgi:serine/threonine-protein kinase